MRATRNAEIHRLPSGEVYAIALGADFCSEHEWGIKHLKNVFGIVGPEKNGWTTLGIWARKITKLPPVRDNDYSTNFYYFETRKGGYLTYSSCGKDEKHLRKMMNIWDKDENPLYTAWSETDFGIFMPGEKGKKILNKFYQAFMNFDISIAFIGGHIFENPSLAIVITSLFPEDLNKEFIKTDLENKLTTEMDAKYGDEVRALLNQNGKRWYALSPRITDNKSKKFKTRAIVDKNRIICYWLNPQEQEKNNFGWFTIEQLEEWAYNNGPIPKVVK